MDQFVDNKLKEWDLFDKLGDVFSRNEIDEITFKSLNDNDIKELIPSLGLRKKFQNKYNQFIIETSEVVSVEVINVPQEIPDDISFSSISSEVTLDDGIEDEPPKKNFYSHKATLGLPYKVAPVPVSSDSTVKKLIETTEEGKLIVASYAENKLFLRNKLSALIVKHELQQNEQKRITSNRFMQLATEIYDYFPHEFPETYFIPYQKDSNGKTKSAKGKLWNTYIHLRKRYKEFGIIRKSKGNQGVSSQSDEACNEDIQDKILWLKNHWQSSPETLQNYWLATYEFRSKENIEIKKYLNSYPFLKQPLGYSWLELDFLNVHKDKGNHFYNRWPSVAKKLYILITTKKKDNVLKTLIEEYEANCHKIIDPNSLSDTDSLFILTLLPLLFGSVALKCKRGSKRWKPSRIEIRQGFILQAKDAADVEIQMQLRREKYNVYGLLENEQPIPIIVGDLDSIEASYVNVNDIYYKVENPVKSVDITFKIYHALNAQYPPEAEAVWTFVEKGIYNITTNTSQKYVAVTALMSDLQQIVQ